MHHHGDGKWMHRLWKLDEMRRESETPPPAGAVEKAVIPADKQEGNPSTNRPARTSGSKRDWRKTERGPRRPHHSTTHKEKADVKDQFTFKL